MVMWLTCYAAFVLKHAVGKADGRPELSAESMLADPERNWRYMKMVSTPLSIIEVHMR